MPAREPTPSWPSELDPHANTLPSINPKRKWGEVSHTLFGTHNLRHATSYWKFRGYSRKSSLNYTSWIDPSQSQSAHAESKPLQANLKFLPMFVSNNEWLIDARAATTVTDSKFFICCGSRTKKPSLPTIGCCVFRGNPSCRVCICACAHVCCQSVDRRVFLARAQTHVLKRIDLMCVSHIWSPTRT